MVGGKFTVKDLIEDWNSEKPTIGIDNKNIITTMVDYLKSPESLDQDAVGREKVDTSFINKQSVVEKLFDTKYFKQLSDDDKYSFVNSPIGDRSSLLHHLYDLKADNVIWNLYIKKLFDPLSSEGLEILYAKEQDFLRETRNSILRKRISSNSGYLDIINESKRLEIGKAVLTEKLKEDYDLVVRIVLLGQCHINSEIFRESLKRGKKSRFRILLGKLIPDFIDKDLTEGEELEQALGKINELPTSDKHALLVSLSLIKLTDEGFFTLFNSLFITTKQKKEVTNKLFFTMSLIQEYFSNSEITSYSELYNGMREVILKLAKGPNESAFPPFDELHASVLNAFLNKLNVNSKKTFTNINYIGSPWGGESLLYMSINYSQYWLIAMLLACGADIKSDETGKDSRMPSIVGLMVARGKVEIAKLIINSEADLTGKLKAAFPEAGKSTEMIEFLKKHLTVLEEIKSGQEESIISPITTRDSTERMALDQSQKKWADGMSSRSLNNSQNTTQRQ